MAAREFARVAPGRAKFSLVLVVALGAILSVRLGNLQIVQAPHLSSLALGQHAETVQSFARRGSILDREGGVLVRSLPSESVVADPTLVSDPRAAAEKLARALGAKPVVIEAALRERSRFVYLQRKVSHDVADRVRALDLEGVFTRSEETGKRFFTSGRLASSVIGYVGTDENGLGGLEYTFDSLLRGKPGRIRVETDNFGRAIPFAETRVVEKAAPGRSIVTTIDPYLQYQAERLLHADVAKWHARSATAIVMDPWTGELLAVANVPDFEPARYGAFPQDAWRNRAIADAYEPGSTFKLITVAAALESGRVPAGMRFPSRDALEVGGRVIHNAEDGFLAGSGSTESMEDVIAYSHNVGAAEIGIATGPRAMYRTMRAFGFGDPTAIELSGENPGIVLSPKDWSGSTLATIAFGHSVSVTPLALIRAYAAIANGGTLMRPRIISAIAGPDGATVYKYAPAIERRRVISERTAATLRKYLRAVVVRGTGNPSARVPGYTTAGKTGTAQVVENGRYEPGAYIASFVGMIPAEKPRYVVLVKVERPQGAIYGSVVAAPVFAELARAAMLHAGVMPAAPPSPRLVRHAAVAKAAR